MIRPLCAEDAPRLASLAASAATAPHWSEAEFTSLFAAEAPARVLLGFETPAAALAGFAIALVMADEAELESIAVAPEYQRQGIARHLMIELLQGLRCRGVLHVHLEVRPSNRAAYELYRALGFENTGSRRDYYSRPDEDALLMRLNLSR